MKSKRILIINSETCEITEGEYRGYEDGQKIVGGLIERATILENGDEIYVNEEGLFQNPNYFYSVQGAHQPFAGNAYIIGSVTASGNNRPAASTIEEIRKQIRFLGQI